MGIYQFTKRLIVDFGHHASVDFADDVHVPTVVVEELIDTNYCTRSIHVAILREGIAKADEDAIHHYE